MVQDKIKEAIEKIRPALQRDGGDIEFVSVEGKTAFVRLKGACSGCPMSHMTIKAVVEEAIRNDVPEIENVEEV